MDIRKRANSKLGTRFKIVEPNNGALGEFAFRFAHLAQSAWLGYSGARDIHWRIQYYEDIIRASAGHSSFRIITKRNQEKAEFEDIGFCTVLPLRREFAELHLDGKLSQYSFKGEHLSTNDHTQSECSFHYVQSIWLHPDMHMKVTPLIALTEALCLMLKKQNCGFEGSNYIVYSETSVAKGRKFSMQEGLLPTGRFSVDSEEFDRREFYVFDSRKDESKLRSRINNLWEDTLLCET